MKGILHGLFGVSSLAVALAVAPGCGSSSGSGSMAAGTNCSYTSKVGSIQTCGFVASTTPNYSCVSPEKTGSCSSSGLVGCCSLTVSSGGYTTETGSCIYDKADEKTAMGACKSPSKWTTTAP